MATARETIEQVKYGSGCLGKAEDDEPVFVLRGQDKLAPDLIRQWAIQACKNGCSRGKVYDALDVAAAMDNWQHEHFGKMPD